MIQGKRDNAHVKPVEDIYIFVPRHSFLLFPLPPFSFLFLPFARFYEVTEGCTNWNVGILLMLSIFSRKKMKRPLPAFLFLFRPLPHPARRYGWTCAIMICKSGSTFQAKQKMRRGREGGVEGRQRRPANLDMVCDK